MTISSKAKPIQQFKLGRIRGAVWENSTERGKMFNLTLSRLYKTNDGNWGDSSSFGRDDLPLVMKVCDLAINWMVQTPGQEAEGTDANDVESL